MTNAWHPFHEARLYRSCFKVSFLQAIGMAEPCSLDQVSQPSDGVSVELHGRNGKVREPGIEEIELDRTCLADGTERENFSARGIKWPSVVKIYEDECTCAAGSISHRSSPLFSARRKRTLR